MLHSVKNVAIGGLVTCLVWLTDTMTAQAASDADYGKRAGEWFASQLQSVWVAAVAAGACVFLFPGARKPALLGGYLAAVLFTGIPIWAPEKVEQIIRGIARTVAG